LENDKATIEAQTAVLLKEKAVSKRQTWSSNIHSELFSRALKNEKAYNLILENSAVLLKEKAKRQLDSGLAIQALEDEKAENKALKATISLLSIEKVTFNETTKVLEEQKAENEALKTELKKARSKADQTSITEACLKEKEAEIVHLKATNGSLSIDLDKAKNTCDIVFEDEQKECKCSVTKILNSDLQKKINRMKELLDLREKEIRLLNDELKNSE
jgi:hypothetical protein